MAHSPAQFAHIWRSRHLPLEQQGVGIRCLGGNAEDWGGIWGRVGPGLLLARAVLKGIGQSPVLAFFAGAFFTALLEVRSLALPLLRAS